MTQKSKKLQETTGKSEESVLAHLDSLEEFMKIGQ